MDSPFAREDVRFACKLYTPHQKYIVFDCVRFSSSFCTRGVMLFSADQIEKSCIVDLHKFGVWVILFGQAVVKLKEPSTV